MGFYLVLVSLGLDFGINALVRSIRITTGKYISICSALNSHDFLDILPHENFMNFHMTTQREFWCPWLRTFSYETHLLHFGLVLGFVDWCFDFGNCLKFDLSSQSIPQVDFEKGQKGQEKIRDSSPFMEE